MTATRHHVLLWLLVTSLLPLGCMTNPATGERELIIISQEQEIALGVEAAPQFEAEFGGKVANDSLQAYVRQVGQSVADVAERKMPYEFGLLDSNVPNAFALPGGKVYITSGLMAAMTGERQLAAVLGHEVGHVAALHNVKGLQRQLGAQVLAELAAEAIGGKSGQAAEAAAKIVGGVINLRYSREDEYQADDLGIRYMTKASYSPWGMVELLTTLETMSESGGTPEFFRTHPLTDKRIERARSKVQDEHGEFKPSASDPQANRFLKMRKLLTPAGG